MDPKAAATLRKCTPDDLDVLQDIALTTFTDTFGHLNDPDDFRDYVNKAFSRETLARQLQNPGSQFFFLFCEKEVGGYMKINFSEAQTDIKDPESLEIERIYVQNRFQKQGLGRLLFHHALDIAYKHRLKYLWLGVWEKNEKALAFYEKQGFKKFAEHPFRLGNDLQTDYLMKLKL